MHFDTAQVLSLVVGFILPLIVGYITKAAWPAGVRAVTLLALSGLSAFLTELISSLGTGSPFDVGATLLAVLGTFLAGVGAHFGLWQPTGLTAVAKRSGVGRND